ncbi:MAG: polysaccharide pyruvyl transferase family protein [Actinomycetes bacterium]
MSIYLISPAGHPNYGDELIAAGWLRHLAAARPESDVWLDCPNPGLASELFSGIHPRLRVTNTLWRACWETGSEDPEVVMKRVAELVQHLGSPAYDMGLERLRNVDTIHMLGGGYLNSLWPTNAGLVAGAVAVRNLTGAKLFATGLSVIPLLPSGNRADGDSEWDIIRLFAEFDHISVRDTPSADALGVPSGLDDAFLAVGHEHRRGLERGGADVVVCLQSDLQSPEQSERVTSAVRELVREARNEGKTVQYVEAIPGVDRAGFDAMDDLIRPEHFIPFISVWRDGLPLKQKQTWLTTRFHLHFMAAAAGAAGVAVGIREGYYDVKHRSLIDLGTGWSYMEAPRPGSAAAKVSPTTEPSFASLLPSRSDQKRREAETLYPKAVDPVERRWSVQRDFFMPSGKLIKGVRTALSGQR